MDEKGEEALSDDANPGHVLRRIGAGLLVR
jgi:hypothetical protein